MQLAAGLLTVFTASALKNLRYQNRIQKDLHNNQIIDVVMRSEGENSDFVRHLTTRPEFSVLLLKPSQSEIFRNWFHANNFRRASLDATGNILAKITDKPLLNHVLVFRQSISDDNYTTPFNLAELVTASQTMQTITDFIKNVKQLVQLDCGETFTPMFYEIVTDKSFANIGAILRAFNDLNLTEYLDVCWKILSD